MREIICALAFVFSASALAESGADPYSTTKMEWLLRGASDECNFLLLTSPFWILLVSDKDTITMILEKRKSPPSGDIPIPGYIALLREADLKKALDAMNVMRAFKRKESVLIKNSLDVCESLLGVRAILQKWDWLHIKRQAPTPRSE